MPEQITITLNPAGVAEPLKRAVLVTTETVGTCIRALENDDLSPPELRAGSLGYCFEGLRIEAIERKALFHNWLFSKAFQDLARAVREMLEEAVFYLTMVEREPGIATMAQIEADMAIVRAQAQKPNFPALLERVNAGLVEPISFEAEYLSLQKVRNCLEHRGGRVGTKDADPSSGSLMLTFPRLKLFYERGKEEVELAVGEAIDTQQPGNVFEGAGGVPILMRRVTRTREYALGEKIEITLNDLAEIAMACQIFADDLASKLPILQPEESRASNDFVAEDPQPH